MDAAGQVRALFLFCHFTEQKIGGVSLGDLCLYVYLCVFVNISYSGSVTYFQTLFSSSAVTAR
jgi:hypothetical protein